MTTKYEPLNHSGRAHIFSFGQLIKVLQSSEEIGDAIRLLNKDGCGYHKNGVKNWDLAQVNGILRKLPKTARILDVGCGHGENSVLRFCHNKGFKNIVGIDLSISIIDRVLQAISMVNNKKLKLPYRLVKGDIAKTKFPKNRFDLIICISVIEHGVNLVAFFKEISRILSPHGILFLSTDYWATPKIPTDDVKPFGLEWNIFSKEEIEDLIEVAQKHNLHIECEVPFSKEKIVWWKGKGYTFISMVFRAVA